MELGEELKHRGEGRNAFQLVSEEAAGRIFGVLAALLFLTDLCDRLGVSHFWR